MVFSVGLLLYAAPVSAVEPPGSQHPDTPAHVPDHRLTLRIHDETGAPTSARVSVTVQDGGFEVPPADSEVPFYRPAGNFGYFYAHKSAVVQVPPGEVRILVSKGPEYELVDRTITITGRRVETIDLKRVVNARIYGWYSGDTHVHINHGGYGDVFEITNEDLAIVADAEDLHLTCALTNGLYFNGGTDPASTPTRLLHFGMEYRSAVYGHMAILGLESLLPNGCCLPGTPAVPLNRHVAAQAHEQGAITIASHPLTTDPDNFQNPTLAWPYSGLGREVPVDVILGGVDAFDVYSYSNYNRDMVRRLWFDLLDLGYRLPLSVGTDAAINRSFDGPAGGTRVYVQCGNEFTLASWTAGLRAGHSFATNGPIPINFQIEGHGPGEVWKRTGDETEATGQLTLFSRMPVQRLEIWGSGALLATYFLPTGATHVVFPFSLTVPAGTAWLVGRLVGPTIDDATVGYDLEALTSPIWVEVGGRSPKPTPAAVNRFDGWIRDLETLLMDREGWSSNTERDLVLAEVGRARQRIAERSRGEEPDTDLPQDLANPSVTDALRWEPSAGGVQLRVPGAGSGELHVFDVQGRQVYAGPRRPLPGPFAWNPGEHPVSPGVYFVRVRTTSGVSMTRRVVVLP